MKAQDKVVTLEEVNLVISKFDQAIPADLIAEIKASFAEVGDIIDIENDVLPKVASAMRSFLLDIQTAVSNGQKYTQTQLQTLTEGAQLGITSKILTELATSGVFSRIEGFTHGDVKHMDIVPRFIIEGDEAAGLEAMGVQPVVHIGALTIVDKTVGRVMNAFQ